MNMVGVNMGDARQRAFLKKIDEICERSTLDEIMDLKNAMALATDPNYNKGDNPIVDVLIENAEEYDEQFLRGVLVGITYCLAVERTFSTPFVKKPHHDRTIPMFDSIRQYILERASSL